MRFQDKVAIVTGVPQASARRLRLASSPKAAPSSSTAATPGKQQSPLKRSILAESAQSFRSAISLSPRQAKRW